MGNVTISRSFVNIQNFELTTAILIWENVELCFGQMYTLTSSLRGPESRFRRRIDV